MRVLITGASRGIGAGIARKLAEDARQRGRTLHLAVAASRPGEAMDALLTDESCYQTRAESLRGRRLHRLDP